MRYVIIGNGVAGTTAAVNIRKIDAEGEITILTEEPYPFYSRIRLMEMLSGEADEKDLIIKKDDWYGKNRIRLILNAAVTDIDAIGKTVASPDSEGKIAYDRLLLATGGLSFMPPIAGADKSGVFTLRTLRDAEAIKEYSRGGNPRVILIGGGVLGLETGNALRKAGSSVTVVEFFPRLLPRQMDADGAGILQSQLEAMGLKFYLGAKSEEIIGGSRADGLLLEDGRKIDCDMIIVSAGVKPNTVLAQRLGIGLNRGILVNERMETGVGDIYTAGDSIEFNGTCYGIWPAAEEQGRVAGINMAGGNSSYKGTIISNRLKVAGVDLISAGDIDPEGKKESIVFKDEAGFIYKKLVISGNVIIGAILYGDIKDRMKVLKAIEDKKDISEVRQELGRWNMGAL